MADEDKDKPQSTHDWLNGLLSSRKAELPAEAMDKLAASAAGGAAAKAKVDQEKAMGETVKQTLERVTAERSHSTTEPAKVSEPAPPPQSSSGHHTTSSGSLFSMDNVVVVVTSELIALPFCFNGADGFMSNDWLKTAKGFGIGLPIGILGLTYPFWRTRLKKPTQDWIRNDARRWWPVALLLAFGYVLGPDIYQRATKPIAAAPAATANQRPVSHSKKSTQKSLPRWQT
jgi:hypothetical protein